MSLKLENVCYTYSPHTPQEKKALHDVSLTFDDRCFTALIGKTGSGKSTLIQHLNALLLPTSGKVSIDREAIDMTLVYKKNGRIDERRMKRKHKQKLKNVKEIRKRVGLVFQFPEYQLFEETVLKDVAYGPKNFGSTDEEALALAKESLSLVGLDESFYERSPFELSGGEKRRVAIAGILALKPSVLVLDEPTVGLDSKSEANLMGLLSDLYDKGTSIILATHNMDVVLAYCHQVVVMDQGRVQCVLTPLELFQNQEFLKTSSLEPPKVFSFAMALKENGLDIDLTKVKDSHSLALEIVRARKEAHL